MDIDSFIEALLLSIYFEIHFKTDKIEVYNFIRMKRIEKNEVRIPENASNKTHKRTNTCNKYIDFIQSRQYALMHFVSILQRTLYLSKKNIWAAEKKMIS